MQSFLVASLDGGGVRGMFTAHFMALTTYLLKFDLLVGTSAGGVVAALVAFGLLNMQTIDKHVDRIKHIFGKTQDATGLMRSKYTGQHKRKMLVEVFGESKLGEAGTPLGVMVVSQSGKPVLFSSWEHPDMTVVDALDATTAAPGLFPPVKLEGQLFYDGGTLHNNPAYHALLASTLWCESLDDVKLLSVGSHLMDRKLSDKHINTANPGIMDFLLNKDFIEVVTGSADNTSHRIFELLLRNRYMRVNCTRACSIDDTSSSCQKQLHDEALAMFGRHRPKLLQWRLQH